MKVRFVQELQEIVVGVIADTTTSTGASTALSYIRRVVCLHRLENYGS